jgi:hypothetical protein
MSWVEREPPIVACRECGGTGWQWVERSVAAAEVFWPLLPWTVSVGLVQVPCGACRGSGRESRAGP